MNLIQNTLIGIGALGLAITGNSCAGKNDQQIQPNIIFILADDLGYGELGCYGQEKIETPNIDQLAATGMRFTQHYTGAPVCAPARCILLTGMNSGRSQVRGNDEWPERGDVWNYRAMLADSTLEGQRPIKAGTITIGRILQDLGYKTAAVGKWGLGAPHTDGAPNKQGFDFFYGYNCQRQAHTYYPVHLWKNNHRVYLNNDTIAPHRSLAKDVDPYDLKNYAPFNLNDYSPKLMMDEISHFVEENKNNPFFLYWATPIPHLPLQAPKNWVDYYVKKFGEEEPYPGRGFGYFPVRYPRATYAAMVSYLDEQVGILIQQLKNLGIYENTLIIFTSDNGPYGPYCTWFKSAAPFRIAADHNKGHLNEGGIRVPMIANWLNKIKAGSISNHISTFQDFMPTISEIIGAQIPEEISGISFLPELLGKKQQEYEYLYWEFPASGGQMAVRKGNMKAIRKNMHKGNLKWEVYNIEKDPEEILDISSTEHEFIKEVEEIVATEHTISENKKWHFSALGE